MNYCSGSEVLPTKNKMTFHCQTKLSYHRQYDLLRQPVLHSWRHQSARHRRVYDENRTASVTHCFHVFPERETKRGQSIVRLGAAGGNVVPYNFFWLDIWRPYCACVKRASVPPVTRSTMHFARCGIRCTMPRCSAPRAVNCDMRRRHRRIAITCDTRVVWERSILGQSALGARTAERVRHRQRACR